MTEFILCKPMHIQGVIKNCFSFACYVLFMGHYGTVVCNLISHAIAMIRYDGFQLNG